MLPKLMFLVVGKGGKKGITKKKVYKDRMKWPINLGKCVCSTVELNMAQYIYLWQSVSRGMCM